MARLAQIVVLAMLIASGIACIVGTFGLMAVSSWFAQVSGLGHPFD